MLAASPVKAIAWQRQPPKSISSRGQLRQGSFIQLGAAILLEGLAVEPDVGETFVFDVVELETGKHSAAWQGSTRPCGVTLMIPRPQPPMHGFGVFA